MTNSDTATAASAVVISMIRWGTFSRNAREAVPGAPFVIVVTSLWGQGPSGPVAAGPADAAPAHAGPAHAAPADSGPADTAPAHAGPADTAPADTGPADTAPAHAGPADTAPAHAGPAHAAPADTGPAHARQRRVGRGRVGRSRLGSGVGARGVGRSRFLVGRRDVLGDRHGRGLVEDRAGDVDLTGHRLALDLDVDRTTSGLERTVPGRTRVVLDRVRGRRGHGGGQVDQAAALLRRGGLRQVLSRPHEDRLHLVRGQVRRL